MRRPYDLTGQRFGRLVVVEQSANHGRRIAWMCECDCGQRKSIVAYRLRQGEVQSCGCLSVEKTIARSTIHSEGRRGNRTPEFQTWCSIRERCGNPNHHGYAKYGGRGIHVCDRWLDSFDNFLADMGRRPSNEHSIDRIDNDGNYEPGNCRWATRSEQMRNRRPRSQWTFKAKVA